MSEFLQEIATGLRGETGTYEGHDKFYWYDYLYSRMLEERRDEPGAAAFLEEITTVTQEQWFEHLMQKLDITTVTQEQRFEDFMQKLTAFQRTGEGYHKGLEAHFPLFKGPAPEGHPYPEAFALPS